MLIQEYNPLWIKSFKELEEVIQGALEGIIIKVEHVGSTAVEGLAAKPIIDMDIVYESPQQFTEIKKRLSGLGYVHVGDLGIPQREVFKRQEAGVKHPVLDEIKHHLYACVSNSEELKRHILFRDFLRNNDWAKKEYQLLKQQLAEETNQDHKAYATLKEERAKAFVLNILELAKKQMLKT